jgi:hypothetical protein
MIDGECGTAGRIRIGRGNRSTRRKPAPVPLCPPQIPHDLNLVRTRAAAVGSQRLTSWAMARPISPYVMAVSSICKLTMRHGLATRHPISMEMFYIVNKTFSWPTCNTSYNYQQTNNRLCSSAPSLIVTWKHKLSRFENLTSSTKTSYLYWAESYVCEEIYLSLLSFMSHVVRHISCVCWTIPFVFWVFSTAVD